jgi:hypothetical protein
MKGGILLVAALLLASAVVAQDVAPSTRRVPGEPPARPAASLVEPALESWFGVPALRQYARKIAESLPPNDGGAILAGTLVLLLVAGRFRPFRFFWNLGLLTLLLPAVFLVDVIARWAYLQRVDYRDTAERGFFTLQFTGLFVMLAWWVLRGSAGAFGRPREWTPNPGRPLLVALVLVLVAWNVVTVLARRPDDCGIYTSLGAQRMIERGTWPYGDEKLRGGAGATYGPVLYATHLAVLQAVPHPRNAPDADPIPETGYQLPPLWPSKLVCLAFHLAGLWALYAIGRRLASVDVGLALVALYAGSPYVFGLGGAGAWAGGLPYVSHIAPAALVLCAFAFLRWPVAAGALLALGAGTVYYPAFFFPAMLGYFTTARKGAALRFLAGFAVTGLLIAGSVVAWTDTRPGESAIGLFFQSTLDHQESESQYGMSPFGFFGVHPALAERFHKPLFGAGGSPIAKPLFLGLALLSLGGFFLGRNRRPAQLAFLLAAIAAAVQLWKTQATGTYVEWYYPLLLIGLFADRPSVGIVSSVGREGPPPPPRRISAT